MINALDMAVRNHRPEPGRDRPRRPQDPIHLLGLRQTVRSAGPLPSFSTGGDNLDNATIESFWSSMQIEVHNHRRWKTRVELVNAIFEYIEIFHNRQRRHSALGYRTPIEYELLSENDAIAGAV